MMHIWYLSCLQQLDHGLPGVNERRLRVEFNFTRLAAREETISRSERNRPVNDCTWLVSKRGGYMRRVRTIEIKVAKTELLEGLVECRLDEVGLMRRVPELGSDEELLAGDDGRDDFFECPTDLVLVLVYPG